MRSALKGRTVREQQDRYLQEATSYAKHMGMTLDEVIAADLKPPKPKKRLTTDQKVELDVRKAALSVRLRYKEA